jgi:mono/diheme cytochrome c family protein|tara:strand:- start:5 stop:358 length:354 start_codon:yes stop_codon:yes gene_type:complete
LLRIVLTVVVTAVLTGPAFVLWGGSAAAEVKLTEAFMNDSANIEVGEEIFKKRCSRCHGQRAYPGKGPKLNPKKYSPKFVYKRITKGFRGMPSWKRIYNEKQRKSLTAYILSKDFSN